MQIEIVCDSTVRMLTLMYTSDFVNLPFHPPSVSLVWIDIGAYKLPIGWLNLKIKIKIKIYSPAAEQYILKNITRVNFELITEISTVKSQIWKCALIDHMVFTFFIRIQSRTHQSLRYPLHLNIISRKNKISS